MGRKPANDVAKDSKGIASRVVVSALGPIDRLSVRDEFAARALAGWLAGIRDLEVEGTTLNNAALAERCYGIADAMLAERRKSVATPRYPPA